jgi:hypothetical protein
LLGFLMFRVFAYTAKWKNMRLDYPKYESLIYVGAMFFGRFLLYNDLGLAKLLHVF